MFEPQEEVARRLGITPTTKVLDLGGAACQFHHGDVTIADIAPPRWKPHQWVRVDVCREPLPFADGEFDVCLCTQTLEDLYNPFLALDEMKRVARSGYIETPHRGLESSFTVSAHLGTFPGWGHHRWMFETDDQGRMKVTPKSWHLMRHDAKQIVDWMGERAFKLYWSHDTGGYEYYNAEVVDFEGDGWDRLLAEHNDFVAKHRDSLRLMEDFQPV